MSLFLLITLFILGLILIIFGSDWFVDATIWIAKVFRIPDLIIGATLVSLCTTLPELLVSTGAALEGDTSMAIGNATGSVACNSSLILGFAILFSTPLLFHKKHLRIKSLAIPILLITILTFGFYTGYISSGLGVILLLLTGLFIYYNYYEAKKHRKATKKDKHLNIDKKTIIKNILLFVVGLIFTIIGSKMMVNYGVKIAIALNVPSIVIAVTMTALGTSLPELVTSITAIRKKATALSIGNIFGANILNLTLVLGLSSIIKPIEMTKDIMSFHLPIILGITIIAALGTWFSKNKYKRFIGVILLVCYFAYMTFTIL